MTSYKKRTNTLFQSRNNYLLYMYYILCSCLERIEVIMKENQILHVQPQNSLSVHVHDPWEYSSGSLLTQGPSIPVHGPWPSWTYHAEGGGVAGCRWAVTATPLITGKEHTFFKWKYSLKLSTKSFFSILQNSKMPSSSARSLCSHFPAGFPVSSNIVVTHLAPNNATSPKTCNIFRPIYI